MCALVKGMTDILTPVNLLCFPDLDIWGGLSYITEPLKGNMAYTVNSARPLTFTRGWNLTTVNNNIILSNVKITYNGKEITISCHVNNTSGQAGDIRIVSTLFNPKKDVYYTTYINIINSTNLTQIRHTINGCTLIYRSTDSTVSIVLGNNSPSHPGVYAKASTGESDVSLTFSDLAVYEGQFVNHLSHRNNIHQAYYSNMTNTSVNGQYNLPNSYANHWIRLAQFSPATFRYFTSNRYLGLQSIRHNEFIIMNNPIASLTANRSNTYKVEVGLIVYNSTNLRMYLDAKCIGTSGGIFSKFRLACDTTYCVNNGDYAPLYLEGYFTSSSGGAALYVMSTFNSSGMGTIIGSTNWKSNENEIIIGSEVVPTSVGENVATIVVPS